MGTSVNEVILKFAEASTFVWLESKNLHVPLLLEKSDKLGGNNGKESEENAVPVGSNNVKSKALLLAPIKSRITT